MTVVNDANGAPVTIGCFVKVLKIARSGLYASIPVGRAIIGGTYEVSDVDGTDGTLQITELLGVPVGYVGSHLWLAEEDVEVQDYQQGEEMGDAVLDMHGAEVRTGDEVMVLGYVAGVEIWDEETFAYTRCKALKVLRVNLEDSSVYVRVLGCIPGCRYSFGYSYLCVPSASLRKVEATTPQITPNPAPPPLVAVRRGVPDLVPVRREVPPLVPVARQEASGDANEAEVSVPYVGVATEAPAAPEAVASTTVPVLAGFRVGDVVRIARAVYSSTDTWRHQTDLVDAEYRAGWNGDAMDDTVGMTGVVTEVNGPRGWVRVVCGVRASMTRWVYSPMSLELVSRETVPALVPVQRSTSAAAQAPTAYKYVTIGGACETEVVLLFGVHDTSRVTLFYKTPPYELRKEILEPLCRATGADLEETLSKDIYATSGTSLGQGHQPGVTKISEILRVTVLDGESEEEDDEEISSTTTDLFWLTEYKVEVDAVGNLNLDLSNVADTFFSL